MTLPVSGKRPIFGDKIEFNGHVVHVSELDKKTQEGAREFFAKKFQGIDNCQVEKINVKNNVYTVIANVNGYHIQKSFDYSSFFYRLFGGIPQSLKKLEKKIIEKEKYNRYRKIEEFLNKKIKETGDVINSLIEAKGDSLPIQFQSRRLSILESLMKSLKENFDGNSLIYISDDKINEFLINTEMFVDKIARSNDFDINKIGVYFEYGGIYKKIYKFLSEKLNEANRVLSSLRETHGDRSKVPSQLKRVNIFRLLIKSLEKNFSNNTLIDISDDNMDEFLERIDQMVNKFAGKKRRDARKKSRDDIQEIKDFFSDDNSIFKKEYIFPEIIEKFSHYYILIKSYVEYKLKNDPNNKSLFELNNGLGRFENLFTIRNLKKISVNNLKKMSLSLYSNQEWMEITNYLEKKTKEKATELMKIYDFFQRLELPREVVSPLSKSCSIEEWKKISIMRPPQIEKKLRLLEETYLSMQPKNKKSV